MADSLKFTANKENLHVLVQGLTYFPIIETKNMQ